MKKMITSLLLVANLYGYGQVIVNDNFIDRSKFIDNTLLTLWGANVAPTSGFQLISKTDGGGLTYNAIKLTAAAQASNGYTTANSLKTLTSIDYSFPFTIDRNTDTVYIQFDAIWDALGGGGESGRLVATLVGDYPPGGASFGEVDNTSLIDPFGKPLYNIRIRNNTTGSSNGPLMLYGAGITPTPEWEKYTTGPWWLPGFSVQAGGGSPGTGPNYPLSGTMKSTTSIVSTTTWKHYTWKIFPERMELWVRNSNQPATANTLSLFMQIPRYLDDTYVMNQILAAHGTYALPPNYDWYRYANAVRIYWRGGDNFSLANLSIVNQKAVTLPFSKIKEIRAIAVKNDIAINAYADGANDQFELMLEHSADGRNFTLLKKILPADIKNQKISILHQSPGKGIHYYRIHIQSPEGMSSFSSIARAEISSIPSVSLYPNPSNGQFLVETGAKKSYLRIFDNKGFQVFQSHFDNSIKVSLETSGIYYYQLLSVDGKEIKTGKLIVN